MKIAQISGINRLLLILALLLVFLIWTRSLNAQAPGAFVPIGNMAANRVGHTATLLLNGTVLITGGTSDPSASGEIFDPVTRTFAATGEMITPRVGHTATLLADGRVLIAGGWSWSNSPLASAELFDPSTGTFTATGSMLTAGTGTATLLYDGRVLMVGTDNELYDPATGTFTVTGAFAGAYATPSVDTAILLSDGTVLIGGCDCHLPPPFYSAPITELYDPGTGTFSLTGGAGGPMGWWENDNTWTLLRNGNVLIVSNGDAGFRAVALLYEPSTRTFSGIGNTTATHDFSTATLLPDGEVLIAGGQLPGGNGSVGTDLYDPATGTFSAGSMTIGRHMHTATLLPDGTVLIAGGYSLWPFSTSSAELYVPSMLTPALLITDLRFDLAVVTAGASYSANISGSGLTAETFFDVRFASPGSSRSAVVLNWQRGIVESHGVPAGLAAGTWTINGVRAHEIETDHTGNFFPVRAAITVTQPSTFSIVDRGGMSWRSLGTSAANVVAGYASIRPNSGSTMPAGLAIVGYRHSNVLVTEASVPASPLIQSGRIYTEVNDPVHTGLSIANPNSQPASVSFFFTDSNGNFGNGNTTIPANGQIAKFLDEFPFNGRSSWSGTFTFNSSVPIAVTAMRVRINERGEFLLSTLPVVDLNTPAATGTTSFPEFADGSGWTTEIVLVNPTDSVLSGTVQFVDRLGGLASVAVNGQLNTSFPYSIAAGSSQKFQTGGASTAVLVGSVRVVPATNTRAPSGLAIFSFRSGGNTVTEAGVPAMAAGTAFRLYAEMDGPIQTAIAVANNSTDTAAVRLELSNLDGASSGLTGTLSIPPNGQTAIFLNEIQGFASLPKPFQGVLRVSSPVSISMIGLRIRYNERNDVLITPTPPVNEAAPPATSPMVFPQIVDSAGYTTQFILFSAQPGSSASGTLQLFNQSGGALGVPLQ
jgi:hypothetical protein